MLNYRRVRLGQLGAAPTVAFAAAELGRCLRRMDPALRVDVLRLDRPDPAMGDVLWVGRDSALNAPLPEVADPALDDAVAIRVENGAGYITGTNDRSVLLAAYRFLRALGFAWVCPGPEGERVPAWPEGGLAASVVEAPSRRHRGVCIEGANTYDNLLDMIDFLPKVGMNAYFMQFMAPFTFLERWYGHAGNPLLAPEPLSRAQVEAMTARLEDEIRLRGLTYHKVGHGWTCEPFGIEGMSWDRQQIDLTEEQRAALAEVNGVRALWQGIALNTNLCYSNPAVRGRVTDAIRDYCLGNPQVDVVHFWLADDSNNHCECPSCRVQRPADWYVTLLNELDDKLTAAGLETRVVFLIYVDLLWAPERASLRHPERFILMFAPITRSYAERYGECLAYASPLPPYERNRLSMPESLAENLAHLRAWRRFFKGDSFSYDYHLMWAHLGDPGGEKCARNLFGDMRDLGAVGLGGMVSCQVQRSFFPTALPFCSMARALWDADADFDGQADAWYAAAFGEDAGAARDYLKAVSELFTLYDGPAFHGVQTAPGPFCLDYARLDALATAFAPFARARAASGGPCAALWGQLALHTEYVRLYAAALERARAGDAEGNGRAVEALFDWMRRHELELQGALDVDNALRVLDRKLRLAAPER